MDRFDFFFRQKVTEAELDAAFDAVEQSILRLMLDNGIVGITSGGQVTENAGTPNLTVDVAGPCTIYDQLGQRVSWSATQDVDCSVDENSNATAVTTPGNEKWLSIFAKFKRVYSDNRLDGEGATIQFNQAEGFEIHVVQGAEAVSATRPALRGDEILLDDVKLVFGQTQILNADIDDTRREWAFKTTSGWAVASGQIEEAIQELATGITSGSTDLAAHKAEITLTPEHDARTIRFVGGSNSWHDGSFYPTQSIYALIDNIILDLADPGANGLGGGDRVGCEGFTEGGLTIANGSIRDMLVAIANEIDDLKKGRLLMQATSMIYRIDPTDDDLSNPINAMAFGTVGQSDGAPNIMMVGGTTVGVVWFLPAGGMIGSGYDRTANTTTTAYVYNDCIWVPGAGSNGGRFIIVGEKTGNTGAKVEYNDDLIGVTWTEPTLTGMTTATDAALCIVLDPDSGNLIVGGANGKVSISTNNGVSWAAASALPAGLGTKDVVRMAVNASGDIIAIATDGTDGIVMRSVDGGDNWADVTPGDLVDCGNDIVWEPAADRFVFLGTAIDTIEQGFVYRSTNQGGTTWARSVINNPPAKALAADGSGRIVGFGSFGTVWMSDDLGVTEFVCSHHENTPNGNTHYTTQQWEDSWSSPDRAYFEYGRLYVVDGDAGFWSSPSYGPGAPLVEYP